MDCGKCEATPMTTETWEAVEIDRCPSCRGIYLDSGELRALMHVGAAERIDTPTPSAEARDMDFQEARCGRCAQPMRVAWMRGIRVDLCDDCGGSFLDEGELHRLDALLRHEVDPA